MNKSYTYKRIDSSRHEIRLVILAPASESSAAIHCGLQHVILPSEDRPRYEALSYVWGNPSVTKEIFLHGESFQVTVNLDAALRHLRLGTRERVLWVDAISINQNDVTEREEQVAIMGLIYQSAQWDLLWMGREVERYRYAMYVLGHRFSDDEEIAAVEFARFVRGKPSIWSHLMAFFEAAVWERMWIVQELALAPEVQVICGSRKLSWESLRVVANILTSPRYVQRVLPSSAEGLVQVISTSSLRACKPPLDDIRSDLLWLWYLFGWATCCDPRDRIFAILSLVTDNLGIKPNYTIETDELFCGFTRKYILQRRDLKILGYRCTEWPAGATRSTLRGPQIGNGTIYCTLPSWCLDFGSPLQPYSPRFFVQAVHNQESWTIVPWTDRSSELLVTSKDPRQLVLLGLSLDKAVIVTESTTTCSHSEIIDKYYDYRFEILEANTYPDDVYFNGDTLSYSYWKTICCGLTRTSKDNWQIAPWKSPTEMVSPEQGKEHSPPEVSKSRCSPGIESEFVPDDNARDSDAMYQFEATLVETTKYHSFCMTEKGYMALVPDSTRPGDVLCVLYGGCTPFVLRPARGSVQGQTEEEKMTLIGPAYVHGFMNGLPLKWLEVGILKERRFILV